MDYTAFFIETMNSVISRTYPFAHTLDEQREAHYLTAEDVRRLVVEPQKSNRVEPGDFIERKSSVPVYVLERARTLDVAAELAGLDDGTANGLAGTPACSGQTGSPAGELAADSHQANALAGTAPAARPLVLNFAHPYTPGGDVLLGARRQEEDLFRKTTLGASLTSPEAAQFYRANRAMGERMFSNAAVVSPCVEVFRNADGSYRDAPFTIAVLSMTAPYAADLGSLGDAVLFQILKARVLGMLGIAVDREYRSLVLGSWGCGAPGNDPRLVARAFAEAFSELEGASRRDGSGRTRFPFDHVCFAVPDRTADQQVFRAFEKQLGKRLNVTVDRG